MWKLTNAPKTQKVTVNLARQFAALDGIRQDRILSERRLGVYRRMVEAGGFRPVGWAKAWCEETKQWYRVNGQHTSNLFAGLTNDQLVNIYATVEVYQCDTIEDVAKLYSTFDSQQQSRNASDINRAFASTIPEFAEWFGDSRFLNLLVSGIAYHLEPGMKTAAGLRTQAERAEVLFDYIPVCLWLREILYSERSNAQKMLRVPVVAAMIGSWGKVTLPPRIFG